MAPGSAAVRTDPALWERVKKKWLRGAKGGEAGKWNARKAMLAVVEYKARGGGYVGRRSPANSLKKWEREAWGYVDGDRDGRYLPAAVRAALTPAERRRENARKRGKKGEWVPYSESVAAKMRKAGVFGGPAPRKPACKVVCKPASKAAPRKAACKTASKAAPHKAACKPTSKSTLPTPRKKRSPH